MSGKPGHGGPPKGSKNGLRTGRRLRTPFTLLDLGPRYAKINEHLRWMQRCLERSVASLRGVMSDSDRAFVSNAVRHELNALMVAHLIRHSESPIPADDLARYTHQVASATDRRDKALAKLGITMPVDLAAATAWDQGDDADADPAAEPPDSGEI